MKILKNKLIKGTFTYTFTGILNKLIPFILLPILTDKLTAAEFGILSNFELIIFTLIPLISLQQHAVSSLKYFKLDRPNLRLFYSSSFYSLLSLTILFVLIGFLFGDYLGPKIGIPSEWIFSIAIFSFLEALIQYFLLLKINQSSHKAYAVVEGGRSIFNLLFSLLFVVILDFSWEGRLFGILIANSAFAIGCFYILTKRKFFFSSLKIDFLKEGVYLGIPLSIYMLSQGIIDFSDRFFITNYIGLEANGIYSAAYKLGMILLFFLRIIQKVWNPYVFSNLNKQIEFKSKLKLFQKLGLLYLGFIILGLIFWVGRDLLVDSFLKGDEFKEVKTVFPVLLLAFLIRIIYGLSSAFLFFYEKNKLLSIISGTNAILNIVLNMLLIPKYGIIGAAVATLSCFLVSAVIVILASLIVMKKESKSIESVS